MAVAAGHLVVADTMVEDIQEEDMVDNKKLKSLKLLSQVSVLAKDGLEVELDTQVGEDMEVEDMEVVDIPVEIKDGQMVVEIKDGQTVVDTPVEFKDTLVEIKDTPVEIKDGPVVVA